jgi:thiol-disulfide isomerase/thioredoxin
MKTTFWFILIWASLAASPRRHASATLLQSPSGVTTSWEDILHHYAGKVIYLDLWASWCGPCRHQEPFLEALRTEFKSDSIVFLSVSIDADPRDWQEALSEMGGHDEATFLLLDGKHSELNSTLHIHGVPRFALLDRNGKFVDKDAPFPSNPEIEGRIRALLK